MGANMTSRAKHSRPVTSGILINIIANLILSSQPTLAQSPRKNFTSPGQASRALYEAVRDRDNQALVTILGAPELSSSGDQERDKLERENFAQKYQEMHRLVRESDGSIVLHIGAENWPFPIPLVATGGKWHFDLEAGSQEVVAREVGENETTAIAVCGAIAGLNKPEGKGMAQNAAADDFAHKLAEGGSANFPDRKQFHGYYFRVLKPNSLGTLLVAYPAEYRSSGVMTFVLKGGQIFERDLGPNTATIATKLQDRTSGNWAQVR